MAFPTLTLAGAGAEGAVTAATGTGAGVLVGTTDMPKSTSAFVFPLAASAFFVESPTPSNAEEAMVVSAGILISFKFGTFLKASSPMVFNDCGSCTFSRFPHFSNVPFSMAVSPSERYTL